MGLRTSTSSNIVALVAVATVGFGLLQGARLLDLNTGPYSPSPYALVGLAVDGLTFITVAVLSYLGRVDRARPLFVAAIVASTAYAVLVASGNHDDLALIGMQVTAGMGWSLSILCWMEVFTSYRPRLSLPMIAAAYLINTLLPPLTSSLLPDGRSIMLLASFALSAAALYWCLRNNAFVAQRMRETKEPSTSMAEALSRTRRAVVSTFAFSLICGFVVELDIFNSLQYAQTDLTGLFGIIAAAAMLAVLLVAKLKKANIDYISPIAALCLVTVLLYRSLDFTDGYVAGALMTTFLISFYVLLWLMFVSEAHERKLPAFFLLGLALGVARLSVALGRFAAQTLLERTGINQQVALVGCVWLLVATLALVFWSYLRYAAKRGAAKAEAPEEAAPALPRRFAVTEAFQQIKSIFNLTNREYEVVGEFAAGRSARHIAEQLTLSEHTVKTHLRHAYAKMGVHSRQELLDLIEEMEPSGEKHGGDPLGKATPGSWPAWRRSGGPW